MSRPRDAAARARRAWVTAMREHGNDRLDVPERVVVMGAGGFVGNAIACRLERDRVLVLRLTRRDVDLLAADGVDRLAARLRPGDVLVAVSALAPCRNAEMLRDNIIMWQRCSMQRRPSRWRSSSISAPTRYMPIPRPRYPKRL